MHKFKNFFSNSEFLFFLDLDPHCRVKRIRIAATMPRHYRWLMGLHAAIPPKLCIRVWPDIRQCRISGYPAKKAEYRARHAGPGRIIRISGIRQKTDPAQLYLKCYIIYTGSLGLALS